MEDIRLDEALDLLLDNALARLLAHRVEGGLLDGVQFIERGDRTNKSPKYPAIILTTGIANPVETTTWTTKFDVPLRIWSQVYSNRPMEGEPAARLGLGFALRLVRGLARLAGGDLKLTAAEFQLVLPAA